MLILGDLVNLYIRGALTSFMDFPMIFLKSLLLKVNKIVHGWFGRGMWPVWNSLAYGIYLEQKKV